MKEPRWLTRTVIDAVHLDQLREHGGLPGLRDENALESALARPVNKWAYRSTSTIFELAAAYGFAIATSHPFSDGNKRTAFMAMYIFLGTNGWEITCDEVQVVATMLAVADGGMTERSLAAWVKKVSIKFNQ